MADGHKGRTLQADVTTEEGKQPTSAKNQPLAGRGTCGRLQTTEITILCGERQQKYFDFIADGHKRILILWRTATRERQIYDGRPQGPHPASGCYSRKIRKGCE